MTPRTRKRKNARSASRRAVKQRKLTPALSADARTEVAGISFSDAASSSSSNAGSPMEDRLPSMVSDVPRSENSDADSQDGVVPENDAPPATEAIDQSPIQVLDVGVAQEVTVETSPQEPNGSEAANSSPAPVLQGSVPQEQPQQTGPSPAPPPVSQDSDDPWAAALDDIAPASTRTGQLTITQAPKVTSPYEINTMEDLKLPDDVNSIQFPKIGNVQLLKLVDENQKIYDGLDLLHGRFVTVRQLDHKKHMRRLRLASRLSIGLGDCEDNKRIYELLMPASSTYVLRREKTASGEFKLYYYWIEPPNHGSLHAYVIERKRLPELQSKEYFRQICQIVEFCHARGVVIRDLKLRKFVFADARRQTVKLDDLDETAICPENKSDPNLIDYDDFDPEDDKLCDRHGCPAYVSPEILDLSKKWYSGKASDVWSLGVLLYVLLVGRYPFYDVTPAGLFTKIRQARIHLSDQDGVRLEARLLIRCMLRRDPKERPTVTEVLANSWLQPKDYRACFKVFDSAACVFWKTPGERAGSHGASAVSVSQPSTNWANGRSSGIPIPPPQPIPASARPQFSGGAKMVERVNPTINGGRRQGGSY